MSTEAEKDATIGRLAREMVRVGRPWWYSGAACLSAGAWAFGAFLVAGTLLNWLERGWPLGLSVVLVLGLAVLTSLYHVSEAKGKR